MQIDVRVVRRIGVVAIADLEIDRLLRAAIHELVTVGGAEWKPRALACPEHLLAGVGLQHDLTREDVDELVLVRVPVPHR